MNEQMNFQNTFDEFAKHHQIVDKDEHYSNGIEYIPVFRVKQWLEHIEQEPVLDKIRAEIEQTFLDDGAMQEYTVEECLRIIDKYRSESDAEG